MKYILVLMLALSPMVSFADNAYIGCSNDTPHDCE